MRRSGAATLLLIVVIAIGALVATLVVDNSPQLGLDLQGGASVVLEPTDEADRGQLNQAIEIIRNRVDALGVAEPDIARQGNSIVVQLPGVRDQQRALEVVGRTAELQFRPVLNAFPPVSEQPEPEPTDSTTTTAPGTTDTTAPGATDTTPPPSTDTTAPPSTEQGLGLVDGELAAPLQDPGTTTTSSTVAPETTTTVPTGTTESTTTTVTGEPGELTPAQTACGPEQTQPEQDDPSQQVTLPGADNDDDDQPDACYVLGPVPVDDEDGPLTGAAISTARATIPQNEWVVELHFKGNRIDEFNDIAEKCFNLDPTCPSRQVAIVLDSTVESAPQIQPDQAAFSPFDKDEVIISGGAEGFPEREAKNLALVLRYGALPVQLEPVTVQTVSATLGKDSLRAGLIAGLGGVALVALYILLYYRALGLVVILGLGIWSALNYSIISYLGESSGLALSLAGVTGIVVSVGVTVDSYVVYFERLKDEIRSGKTIRSSVDRGFKRAFRTILAADTSSFIGAALLYWLTVGPVRGFAFFLGLATILDVITSYFFTRPLVAILARSRFFTEARYVGVARGLGTEAGRHAAAVAGGGG